jgi:hypothetical protein
MILLGIDYWNPPPLTEGEQRPPNDPRKPAWPLLTRLAEQAKDPFRAAVKLTDDPEEVVRFISDFHARLIAEGATWKDRTERFKGRAVAVL